MSKVSWHVRVGAKSSDDAPQTEGMVLPTTVRVVEDHLGTVDELGNRRTLIRIRTLVRVPDPMGGLIEVERDRRHTLPGFGHVYPVAEDEYVVFNGRMKLRLDPDVAVPPQHDPPLPQHSPPAPDAWHERDPTVGVLIVSESAPIVRVVWRRERLPVFSAFFLALLALAIWTSHPTDEAAPSFAPLSPAVGKGSSATMPGDHHLMASPATLMRADSPRQTSAERAPVRNKGTPPSRGDARVSLAIRPWGEVYVNGKRVGITPPMKELRLTAGSYDVEIRNPTFAPHREIVDLRGNGKVTVAHEFGSTFKSAAGETATIAIASRPARLLSEQWPR